MSKRLKKALLILTIIFVVFVFSFCDFNGIYYVASIPLIVALFAYKNTYFFFGFAGMMLAAFAINGRVLPFGLIASFSLCYLLTVILNKFDISLKLVLGIIGGFLGFGMSWTSHFSPMHTPMENILLVPALTFFLSYCIAVIQIDLKSKENFSLTKKQLIFFSFFLTILMYLISIPGVDFKFNLVLILIFDYLLIRVDPLVGTITTLSCIIFNLQNMNWEILLFFLTPLLFAIKQMNSSRYLRASIYFLVNAVVMIYLRDDSYVKEIVFMTAIILLIPDKFISFLKKFVVEPQDFELKLYQQSYYKCLSRNKKVQKVMNLLEEQMRNNPRMKKNSKDIMLENMSFLGSKLKEEEDIQLKDHLSKDLAFNKASVLNFKIFSDYLSNYKIYIETRNSEVSEQRLIEIFQERLQVKLKIESKYSNYMLNSIKYILVNEEKITFNLSIKQRSKEANSCGDSYLRFTTKNKKYLLISDGMGHGKRASKDSSAALLLLKNFIELGMSPAKAIISCNALIHDKEKENFNTLDLLEYDTFDNKIYLYKNGSGPTYLKKSNEVEKITSENLPLGIVENIKVDKLTIDTESKYIILTSDGFKKDLKEVINKSKARNSKILTNEILEYEGKNIDDDQTIIVISVIKSK